MAIQLVSPGVLIREVDLTVGRADNVLDNIGAIAGPFEIGPIDDPITIETEQDLINTFGKPLSTDSQYEYWMTAASFLSYGGIIKVCRTDDDDLKNSNAGVGIANTTTLKIKSYDDYQSNYQSATDFYYASKNPGQWAKGLKVAFVDDIADQTLTVSSSDPAAIGCTIGYGVTAALSTTIPGNGTTSTFTGYLKGIITGVSTDAVGGKSSIDVKVISRVETVGGGSTETKVDYTEGGIYAYSTSDTIYTRLPAGTLDASSGFAPAAIADWYDNQTLQLDNATVYWKSIAQKPVTNQYSLERGAKSDAMHVVVVDDDGTLTGIKGNILEKHISLSKALDAESSGQAGTKVWYKNYLADFSERIYAGYNPSVTFDALRLTAPVNTGFGGTEFSAISNADAQWGQNAKDVKYFAGIGATTYELAGGNNYTAANGFAADLGSLMTSFEKFQTKDEIAVDYLLAGPGSSTRAQSQAKFNKLGDIAETRKDCVAICSPQRSDVVNITNSTTQTNNVVATLDGVNSSSYQIMDSGYKYMFDRFNNEFRWVPCNGDIGGLMVRTNREFYPWFSPAGQQRGVLNNATKLAYNPTQAQRDTLYTKRINPIIFRPGIGIMLFGDKTALGYASAFDRINVRRLFLTIEQALERAAQAQLFEFNDEITRANFVNIVEPYLRDVQSKRGLYDFLVICDETNNTPDVIDNNEFRADIFLKPAKSINFVSLTFVATRTGVSFEEVAGRV
jgi:hypothetical protein